VIASLQQELKELKERFDVLESQVAITTKVNTALAKEVDRLEQYGRRNSIVIRGILPKENETNDQLKGSVEKVICNELGLKKEFGRDFDKTHRIGPVITTPHGDRQDVIVRFRSHATRYEVYRRRKQLKTKSLPFRITPSLTKARRKLLSKAREEFESHPDVNFVYVNEHGDVKVRFHEKWRNKFVYDVSSIEELRDLMEANGEDADLE
jgi:FtsZ-binding cell division protein ZapB